MRPVGVHLFSAEYWCRRGRRLEWRASRGCLKGNKVSSNQFHMAPSTDTSCPSSRRIPAPIYTISHYMTRIRAFCYIGPVKTLTTPVYHLLVPLHVPATAHSGFTLPSGPSHVPHWPYQGLSVAPSARPTSVCRALCIVFFFPGHCGSSGETTFCPCASSLSQLVHARAFLAHGRKLIE
jgi:hypothetical protein